MTGPSEHASWSARNWVLAIAAVFVLQVQLIVLLGERPVDPPRRGAPFQAMLDESVAPVLVAAPEYDDPALFALPSFHGFSGRAWMPAPAAPHRYHEWSEPQRWLQPPLNLLGQTFVQYVKDITGTPLALTQKPAPQTARPDVEAQPVWLPERSTMQIQSRASTRRPVEVPALPDWPCNDVLVPTEVEILVDARGRVLSAVLKSDSGLPEADAKALEFARDLRFNPGQPDEPANVLRLVFQWRVVPAPAGGSTNAAPATAPSP